MAYTAAVAGNDQAAKTVAKQNLEGFAERLGLYFSDVVRNMLAADPVTDAITAHDQHLINHVDAYAAKDYTRAQQLELEGYQQMLGVANTLVGAIQRTVKPRLPVGGSSTVATGASDRPAKGAEAARGFRSTRGYRATPVPVRVEIPKIDVVSRLDRLGRAPDGTVQEPTRWAVAGWYAAGTRPGDPGSAVILGHVDSKGGPAVFFRLRELRQGDMVTIERADGSVVRFVVQRTKQYAKDRFPTDEVYYPTLTPALRLVTCGGESTPPLAATGPT
jgi:sortase (surface protein transpeptidase)